MAVEPVAPPPGLLPRLVDFENLWYLSSQIGDGGQGEIYKTFPRENNKNHDIYDIERLFVTKIININNQKNALQRIVKCYLFVQKHKLLNIYGIYHDHKHKQILIVMQRLSHELEIKYLIESRLSSPSQINLRFARPGFIYINNMKSIKLFIYQIISQLNILHIDGGIHFDIKPENIMFNSLENKWCIIDYDLMKLTDGILLIDHYRGTQSWTSPEMSTRSNKESPSLITNKTDIFSFGLIILYILQYGQQPYLLNDDDIKNVFCKQLISSSKWRRDKVYFDKLIRNGNGNNYLQKHLEKLKILNIINYGLYDLLKNMLIFDVKKRFNSQQILNHSWLTSTD